LLRKAKQDVADMAAKTHTILIAGGSGLVGHAAIKFAIAAGHFVIALVRRGGSLSVGGLASEETLKISKLISMPWTNISLGSPLWHQML
jgi:NADPH:quinone reductase-like Zn-dependent oxidoreductase